MESSSVSTIKNTADTIVKQEELQQAFCKSVSSFMEATKGITPSQAVVATSLILGATCVAVKASGVAKKVMFYAIEKGQAVKWKLGPFDLTTTAPNTAA